MKIYANYSREIARLCGYDPGNKEEIYIRCPYCHSKNKALNINLKKGVFRCNKCNIHGSVVQFYADQNGIADTKDAYVDLLNKVGTSQTLTPNSVKYDNSAEEETSVNEERANRVYSKMLSMRSLSKSQKKAMLNRGFSEEDLVRLQYGCVVDMSTPILEIGNFIKSLDEKSFEGVPNFYVSKKGNWWMMTGKRGIMVPYRSMYNKIRCIQVRKDDDVREMVDGVLEHKCYYLSSANRNHGTKACQNVHYAGKFKTFADGSQQLVIKNGTLLLTEGAMKGDLFYCLTGQTCMAIPGVHCLKALKKDLPDLIKLGLKQILIAYDMDKLLNIHVLSALVEIQKLIESYGIEVSVVNWSTAIVKFDGSKGKLDADKTFIYNLKTFNNDQKQQMLDQTIKESASLGRAKICFAYKNREEALTHKEESFVVEELAKKYNLSFERIFWDLNLKGIDDYYAYHIKGIMPV